MPRCQDAPIDFAFRARLVYHVFLELQQKQRLDTNRVFLSKDKAIQRIGTGCKAPCRCAGIVNLKIHDFLSYGKYESQAGRAGYFDRYENSWS